MAEPDAKPAAATPAAAAMRNNAPASPLPPVRSVHPLAPLRWLRLGFGDLRRAPAASLFYGIAFALMGWLIWWVFQHAYEYPASLTAGFLLVGPFLCAGLYDISRRLEHGEPATLRPTLTAWRANVGAFSLFALLLTIVMLVWARASLVTFALFFSAGMPTLKHFMTQVVSLDHWDFIATYFAVGGLFAAIVYALSVVSVPMMLDRGTDTIVASLTSVRALLENFGVLLLWALLIVLVVGTGFVTLFVGLIVAVPVVGHATWHAYRELVGPAGEPRRP